jgi:hypothetical protein
MEKEAPHTRGPVTLQPLCKVFPDGRGHYTKGQKSYAKALESFVRRLQRIVAV